MPQRTKLRTAAPKITVIIRIWINPFPRGRVRGICIPPCSKSYAQRALAASLLAEGTSRLHNIEFCDDTRSAIRCIEALGARVRRTGERTLEIDGGLSPAGDRLYVGQSGLSTRLFTPIASLCDTPIGVVGEGPLLHRSFRTMIRTLRALRPGSRPQRPSPPPYPRSDPGRRGSDRGAGFLPVHHRLLLALPIAEEETTIHVPHVISTPYIDITIDTAERFGIEILHKDYKEFYVAGGQRYRPAEFEIESDWSAAAFLLVAGAVAGEVTIRNLSVLSRQADTAVMTALIRAGASVIDEGDTITVAHRPLQAFSFDATHVRGFSRPWLPWPLQPKERASSREPPGWRTRRATAPSRSARSTPNSASRSISTKRIR